MQIIPSIDLIAGKVVRLVKGNPKTVKNYSDDPITTAVMWEEEGADAIHIVDLDAAFGYRNNLSLISKIIDKISIPTQVGGGIRERSYVETLMDKGVQRIVLGTLAFNNQDLLRSLVEELGPDRVVVALDHLLNKVMVKGWRSPTDLHVEEALKTFRGLGVKIFLITAIDRDGTLKGPDLETLLTICRYSDIDILASGGVSSIADLLQLRSLHIKGVVIGKALYEHFFTLNEAIIACKK